LSDLGVAVALDAAVDGKIHGSQEPVAFVVVSGLDPFGAVFVVEQIDAFADQSHRGFEQQSVEGDGAVFGHGAAADDAEVVFEVFGCRAQALHMLANRCQGAGRWRCDGAGGRRRTRLPGRVECLQAANRRQGGRNCMRTVRKNLSILPFPWG
jgi:hypothetical protein